MSKVDHIIARAPNHLGDGIMAMPALHAIARIAGRFEIQAPSWGPVLYRDIGASVVGRGSIDAADVAVLFPPSFRVAWEARRASRRVGISSDWRRWLLTDVVEPGHHQRDTYRALAEAVGAHVEGEPIFKPVRSLDVDVPEAHIGLNPVSKAGAVREWPGFGELASQLRRPVVFYGGPGESERVYRQARGHQCRVGLDLDAFATALQRCTLFVTNDSGSAHFARACGVPTLVLFGSTTASRTGPAGSFSVEGPALPCRPCYRRHCAYSLECLDISVEHVLEEVQRVISHV